MALDETPQAPKMRLSDTPPPPVRVSARLWGDLPLDGLSLGASVYPFGDEALFPLAAATPEETSQVVPSGGFQL